MRVVNILLGLVIITGSIQDCNKDLGASEETVTTVNTLRDIKVSQFHTDELRTGSQAADVRAAEFYNWYVTLLAEDKLATDNAPRYATFVTRALRAKIARLMESEDGLDADYFIKTQDFDGSLGGAYHNSFLIVTMSNTPM